MQKHVSIVFVLGLTLLAACQLSAPAPSAAAPSATTDLQGTIDAGIAATMQAQTDLQATIDAAVAATLSVVENADQEPLSEDEMAAEIDSAVTDAAAATTEIAATADEIAADGTITQEEYDELEALLVDAAILLDYAEYWIETYYWYYGELAEETLVLLQEIEDLLVVTEENLDEIVALLEAGTDLAEDALAAIDQFAQNASEAAASLEGKSETWQTQLEAWQQTRSTDLLEILPSQIPADRAAALQEARNYALEVRAALEDRVISAGEIQKIAQIGANAVAGLEAHGGIALQGLAGNIDQLTQFAAMGQFGQLSSGLGTFEAAIPARP
jgi:hypothetical protein